MEPAAQMAGHARDVLGLAVTTGLATPATVPPRGADAICLWHVLEHVPEPLPTVATLLAGLAPGGRLWLEVPNAASAVARRQGPRWRCLEPDVHVAHYTPAALRALLARAGAQDVAVQTTSFATYASTTARRLRGVVAASLRARGPAGVRDGELLRATATVGDAAPGRER